MKMTTVTPSPASPTEGDDLCERDGTNVAIHSVTLLISLCGLVGNGAVLGLLSLKIRNAGIFNLAFADFLFLLFTVPSTLLFLVEDVSCSPIMPRLYLTFLFQLSFFSSYWALYRLIGSSSVVNMFKLCCRCRLPKRLLWLVDSVEYWAFFALFAVIPAVSYLCSSHEQGHCQTALISMYTLILLLFPVPVVISGTINFIKAKRGSKKLKHKRRDVVFLLMVLVILIMSLCNFLQGLGYIVSSKIFFLLNCIHSSIKPFIYFLAGRHWRPCSLGPLRLSLQRVFDDEKGKTACSKNAPEDTQSEPGDPLQCSTEGIQRFAALIDSLNNRTASLKHVINEYAQPLPPRDGLLLQEKGAGVAEWLDEQAHDSMQKLYKETPC